MKGKLVKRSLIAATLLVVALGIAAPYLEADRFRPGIQRALERGLGRRVEVGRVHFTLLSGPGFTLDNVVIYDDPRAGIEPFAYVGTLDARIAVGSLFSRKLAFSSLHLNDASINLVKTADGPWNLQFLARGDSSAVPSIKMRGGRVNFKFGDIKSVFYFNDADLDVAPSQDSVGFRFSGAPSRTDRSAQNFGHFFVRGISRYAAGEPRLEMKIEVERTPVDEITRVLDRGGFGVHGIVALEAQVDGPPSHLQVAGRLQIDDVHRWDLLPQRGGGWQFGYAGLLDLRGETLELHSTADAPNPTLEFRVEARDLLASPQWGVNAQMKLMPVATVLEVVRHMSGTLPERLAATGSMSGGVRYSAADGLVGKLELDDASVTLPDADPLRTAHAVATIEGSAFSLDRTTVSLGDESAEIEGSYVLGKPGGLDLKIVTKGLSVEALQSFHLAAIPMVDRTSQGRWRGWARYRASEETTAGEWSGEYELQNARIAIEGLAEPLQVQSAAVSLNGARVSVTKLRAKAGEIAFTGEYRWEPAATWPHKFKLAIPQADSAELERLWAPVLDRSRGFIARALLGSAPLPAWFKARHADGTISVAALTVGDTPVSIASARVLWDGSLVRLAEVKASVNEVPLTGNLEVDLSKGTPHYRFTGKMEELAYKGGKLDFDGWIETEGNGADLVANARAEGRVHGRAIAFAADADFRTVAGCFEMTLASGGLRWKLSGLEIRQSAETYYGQGATQADGRLVLDLTGRGRPVRFTGSPVASAAQ